MVLLSSIRKHLLHYIFLLAILFLGFGSFLLVGYDRQLQTNISVLISVSYFSWGMVHHFLKDDLHPKIVLEYLLISALVFLLLFTIVQRA